MEEEKLTVEL